MKMIDYMNDMKEVLETPKLRNKVLLAYLAFFIIMMGIALLLTENIYIIIAAGIGSAIPANIYLYTVVKELRRSKRSNPDSDLTT